MITLDVNKLDKGFDKQEFISQHMDNMNIDIEFIYCSHFKNAKILRDFVEIIWYAIGLKEQNLSRFILVIDEMNNNAIEYGSDECGKNKMRVKITNNGDSLDFVIEVEDNGKGPKHKSALEMETLRAHQLKLWYAAHNSIRWRWLFMIIVNSVDRLYFKDSEEGGLIVWIKKNLPKEK